ncbi:DUF551 domain-containing protein [Escherichia coli]|nr:DUF551 domain-containing protein [Escherichia coli]
MITLTKEWLLKTIAELEEGRDATPGAVNEDAARALAAMKLALKSLEAEAVACPKCNDTGMADSGGVQPWGEPISVPCDCTAPPAPVSVPDAMTPKQASRAYCGEVRGYRDGWNACRAAMLQGADGNSPVIPDGWVACSEQMPEENAEQEVLACFKGGDISTLYYFEGRWDDAYGIVPIRQDVTHWMPLPSAPQQEAE